MASFVLRNVETPLWTRARAQARQDNIKFKDLLESLLRQWLADRDAQIAKADRDGN